MSDALLIFSRYPRLGKVKTRLAPLLTAEGCLRFYRALLLDTLERLSDFNTRCYLFLGDCSPQELGRFGREQELPPGLRLRSQQGDDLGQRMWNAYQAVHPATERVVFLGCDTPSLPLAYIRQALACLVRVPVVVGPVEDGGYYLLALSRPIGGLFTDIDWGTSAVLEQTLKKAKEYGYELLPSWYDVDTASDLRRLQHDMGHVFPGFPSRTSRFLESL